ncbi:MAG: hypothetical protein ACH350_07350 [Parachlamydiaceae bacterium]
MYRFTLLFFTLIIQSQNVLADSIITYNLSGGRFGDNLLSYLHAKWLSYSTEIPLHIKIFPYAQDLVLYDREIIYGSVPYPKNVLTLGRKYHFPDFQEETSYVVPYFPESTWEYQDPFWSGLHLFQVDWKSPTFRKIALEFIAPKSELTLTLPPKNCVSIAIHVREGGNFDTSQLQFDAPLKRPPLNFYSEAITEVMNFFDEQTLYFYIFTDACSPENIANIIRETLPKNHPIEINYRTEQNHDKINVLEDFFSLFHYDVLIRPYSNFSIIPELLHDYAIVVTPEHASIYEANGTTKVIIDEINVKIDEVLYDRLLNKMK